MNANIVYYLHYRTFGKYELGDFNNFLENIGSVQMNMSPKPCKNLYKQNSLYYVPGQARNSLTDKD